MSHELDPKVGRWYRQIDDDELFKVVSIDEDDDRIEIRYADGDVDELDSAGWIELDLERAEQPEDWRDPDEDEDEDLEAAAETDEDDERGEARRPPKRPSEDWDDDDDDDDDWDDEDDDLDRDR